MLARTQERTPHDLSALRGILDKYAAQGAC